MQKYLIIFTNNLHVLVEKHKYLQYTVSEQISDCVEKLKYWQYKWTNMWLCGRCTFVY